MDVTNSTEFGQAIRERRRQLGFSQDALAAAAGVNQRYVSELERGKPTAEIGKALQVARAVGLRVQLVGGS